MIRVGSTRRNPLARGIQSAGFSPRSIFAPSTIGAIYAYDSLDYLHQKFDGTAPVTALEQPLGLVMDQRFGGAVGATELVTNGSFATDTVWSKGADWTISGGVATKVAGTATVLSQAGIIPLSGWCVVTFTAVVTAGQVSVRLGGTSATLQFLCTASGTYTVRLPVQGSDQTLRFTSNATFAGTLDNVSVRELPGIHAYQTTDAARPTLRGTPRYASFDRVDDHWIAANGGGSTTGFMLAGSIQPASAGTARTIFSDRGTNAGYKVEIDTSNRLVFTAGNGSAFTTCTGPTLTAGTDYAFCVWHDGTNLNIRVGTAATVQQAFATASAGTSTLTLFKDNASAAGYFAGRVYALTFIRNATGINESVASQLIGWSAAKGGFAP